MSAAHTSGKLEVKFDGTCSAASPVLVDDGGNQVCECETSHIEKFSVRNRAPVGDINEYPDRFYLIPGRGAISVANARRLAACWNAFDGLDTETVESMVNVPAFFFKYMALMEQRDALLSALIRLESMAERYREPGATLPDAQKDARAAIAKAESKA